MKGMRRSSNTPQRLQPPRVSVVSGLSSAAQAYGRPCKRVSRSHFGCVQVHSA